MTPEQFKQRLNDRQRQISEAVARTLPKKIGVKAVHFARDNFRAEGFVDDRLDKWKPAKRKSDPKNPHRAYGTLLSRREVLYRSVNHREQPGMTTIYTNVPYAKAHNEGTNNAGRGHKTVLPKRQFIGPSKTFDGIAMKTITDELRRILTTD